jgi:hypothetical protein
VALADDLVAYWSLDEASGNAIDAHSAYDLTDTNTVDTATGKVGNARDFERTNSEGFTHADDAAFSRGDTDFTFACWVNAEAFGDKHCVINKGEEYSLETDEFDSNKFYWNVNNYAVQAKWTVAPSTATWYFLACWHDSVNNLIGISLNAGTAVTTSHSGGVNNTALNFAVGFRQDGARFWDGLIDELGLWGRVLTSDEITELYNSGSGRDYAYITGGGGGGGVIGTVFRSPVIRGYAFAGRV